MANKILSKKIIIPAIIFFGGLLIAFGILVLTNFTAAKLSVASQSFQWTQPAGEGISVPACGSGSPSVTCSGGNPVVTINWIGEDIGMGCYDVDVRIMPGMSGQNTPDVFCYSPGNTGTFTWNGAINNTAYSYSVWLPVDVEHSSYDHEMTSGSFTTPNCALGTVQGFKVKMPGNDPSPNPPAGETVQLDGGSPTTANPYFFTNVSAGTHTVSVSVSSGWSVGYTLCYNDTTCHNNTPTSGNSVNVNLPAGGYADLWWHYTSLPGSFNLNSSGAACNSVPLTWTAASGADGYRILRGSPRVDISPYQPYTALNFTDTSVSQNTTYQYQIEAYNAAGTNRSNTINVTTPYCPPTVNLSGNPTSIFQGQSSTLLWTTANTYPGNSCIASGAWSGNKAGSGGSEIVFPSPPPSATYNLTCSGPGGSVPGSATINITPLALPNWREIIPR